jgi:23S rRNA (cytosine1962-C5)-methyltransferase
LYARLEQSIQKRVELLNQRDNLYLVFGEADFLPGLFIQKMGELLLIQLYTESYKDNMKVLLQYLKENLKKIMPQINWQGAYIQYRSQGKSKKVQEIRWQGSPLPKELQITEFRVNYQIRFNDFYDHGIYTDMSGIREKLKPLISSSHNLLNLYCYTGAFSLFALSLGVENVTSVDLSTKYLDWFNENLRLNPELLKMKPKTYAEDVVKYLQAAKKSNTKFDFIICDPPSFSSNGKSSSSAFKQYETLLPLCLDILEPGGKLAIFLNTHSITKNKFLKKVEDILRISKVKTSIIKHLTLEQDCPRKIGFPEGDYLKGFLIEKK